MVIRASNPTIYFGYGSNLWRHQMHQRCPTSKYLGIARLNGYRWIINERGYANIVEVPADERASSHSSTDEVWGLVYSLEPRDEANLDVNEGVPVAYTKEDLKVDYWTSGKEDNGQHPDLEDDPSEKSMLVYINRKMVSEHEPKKEYIYRMNMGIKDALKEGMPEKYVEKVMRRFVPELEDESVAEVARRQALVFEDER